MKFKKIQILSSFLLLFILASAAIIYSLQAKPFETQHNAIAMNGDNRDPLVTPTHPSSVDALVGFFNKPGNHFEPFLLFLLGVGLLSIATGIKMMRSKRLQMSLTSSAQGTTEPVESIHLPMSGKQTL